LHHRSTISFRHHAIYFHHHAIYFHNRLHIRFCSFLPIIRAFFRVRELSFGRQARGRAKKIQKKNSDKKSQICIQVGLTRFLLVQSEFSPNWTVSSVFDSFLQQTSIGHNFCIRTPFSTCDHSKCSAQKVLSSTSLNAQNSQKSPGRSSFCPLKFWT
jgi:hypothetical protein